MKKILFIGLSAFLAFAAQAQENNQSILFEKAHTQLKDRGTVGAKVNIPSGFASKASTASKKTRGGSRWYGHVFAVDTLLGGNGVVTNKPLAAVIWHDTTIRQEFTGGAGTINYCSYYNVLDPTAPVFNDPAIYGGLIQVGPTNTYTVDSLIVYGEYARPKGGLPDTLIISVVKGSANQALNDIFYYNIGKTAYPEMITNGYVTGNGADTSMSLPTIIGDSVKSIGVNKNQSFVIKRVLTDADTSSFIRAFVFALPTPLTGDLNLPVGVTVTYKTGNPWIANVDTVSEMNHFYGIFCEEATGLAQTYRGNSPDFDINMSGMMFASNRDSYSPSFMIEMWNTIAVDKELAWVEYHVNCASCGAVAVNDIKENVDIKVTPNPASDYVNFSFSLDNSAKNVSITLTNLLGQQVKNINIGAVTTGNTQNVNMSVKDLPTGLYIYTLQVDGQKLSNKILVN